MFYESGFYNILSQPLRYILGWCKVDNFHFLYLDVAHSRQLFHLGCSLTHYLVTRPLLGA